MNESHKNFINYVRKFKYCHKNRNNEKDFILDLLNDYPLYWEHIMTYIFTYYGFNVTYLRLSRHKEIFTLQKDGKIIKLEGKLEPMKSYYIDVFNGNLDAYIVIINIEYNQYVEFRTRNFNYEDISIIINDAFTKKLENILNFIILKTCTLKYLCIRFMKKNIKLYKKLELRKMQRDIRKMFHHQYIDVY